MHGMHVTGTQRALVLTALGGLLIAGILTVMPDGSLGPTGLGFTGGRVNASRVSDTLEAHGERTPIGGGVWQLPEGDAFYVFLVRQYTTTDMTPAQVHELGLREVERTHREMAAIMARVGFKGTVKSFMQQMKADPRFYLADDEAGRAAYLARARGIVAAMQGKLPEAFLKPPPLRLEILPTPFL